MNEKELAAALLKTPEGQSRLAALQLANSVNLFHSACKRPSLKLLVRVIVCQVCESILLVYDGVLIVFAGAQMEWSGVHLVYEGVQ